MKLLVHHSMPLILGHDFSGTIINVGTNVKDYKIGDTVYGRPKDGKIGTFAEYISVDPEDIALKPHNLSFEEAAALPLVSLTAYQALHDIMKIKRGAEDINSSWLRWSRDNSNPNC